jgi:hypothetical protein
VLRGRQGVHRLDHLGIRNSGAKSLLPATIRLNLAMATNKTLPPLLLLLSLTTLRVGTHSGRRVEEPLGDVSQAANSSACT